MRLTAGVAVLAALAIGGYVAATNERTRRAFAAAAAVLSDKPPADVHAAGGHAGHAPAAHHHDGDAPTVQATVWANQIDVFLERPLPVARRAIEPLFHVTVLKNGRPVGEGRLLVRAVGPAGEVVEAAATPARPGIFIPAITFPSAGVYRWSVRVVSPQLDGGEEAVGLPEAVVYAGAKEALAAGAAAAKEPAEAITFLKEQQWRSGLTTTAAAEREIVERLTVPGRVIVPSGSGAVVSPPIAGKLAPPPGGFPRVGDKVKRGQAVAVVEPTVAGAEAVQLVANRAALQALDAELGVKQIETEAKIRAAELSYNRALHTRDRRRELAKEGIAAGKELFTAEHEFKLAEAECEGQRRVAQSYTEARQRLAAVLKAERPQADRRDEMAVTMTAPLSGTIVEAAATAGEVVDPNRRLFYVVDLETLWIEANVSEHDLGRIHHAPGASYRLPAWPDRVVSLAGGGGRLVDIGAVVDPDTRTVPIRFQVSNTEGMLRVGMFAELLLETTRRHTALAVPKQAVLDEGGESVVYLQRGGETFERRHVDVGLRDAEYVEVRGGLAKGDRVATAGAYSVRLSTLSTALSDHGHAH